MILLIIVAFFALIVNVVIWKYLPLKLSLTNKVILFVVIIPLSIFIVWFILNLFKLGEKLQMIYMIYISFSLCQVYIIYFLENRISGMLNLKKFSPLYRGNKLKNNLYQNKNRIIVYSVVVVVFLIQFGIIFKLLISHIPLQSL